MIGGPERMEIISLSKMSAAERYAIDRGTPSYDLMRNAGQSDAADIHHFFECRKALVLCGPGNNGGDGFVVASCLLESGWTVRCACLRPLSELKGDAARAASEWAAEVVSFDKIEIFPDELVVDAVFGTGFRGALDKTVRDLFARVRASSSVVAAVDIPSGIDGDSGVADEAALQAAMTITFFRKKPGHVLLPGRAHCGEVRVQDIGIPDSALEADSLLALENNPLIWRQYFRIKTPFDHKLSFGHAVILGGERMTGAALLAAHAAMRVQVGMCTIAGPQSSADVYRSYLPALLYEVCENFEDFSAHIEDSRRNAVLLGPGAGQDDPEALRKAVISVCALGQNKRSVLDADALNVFQLHRAELFDVLHEHCVLTPHEGEFQRLFPDLGGTKIQRARDAAALSGAIVIYKGADTVIAAPDGRCAVNTFAPPWLATAGTGDVLAGMVLGLLAQGMPPFEASCAAVWLHARAAGKSGPGFIAPDLPELIPAVLRELA